MSKLPSHVGFAAVGVGVQPAQQGVGAVPGGGDRADWDGRRGS
jgi:hypothetical protein